MKHIAKILVFALLVSLLCIGGTALAADDYVGVWEYDEYYMWYQLNDDGTWSEYYRDGLAADGYYEETSSGLQLYLPDGSGWQTLYIDGSVISDSDDDTMFSSSLPEFETSELTELGAPGVWEYTGDDMDAWIQIYEGGNFVLYDDDGAYTAGTVRILDDGTVGLMEDYDDDDEDALMALTFSGDTAVDTEGEEFVRSELPYDTASAGTAAQSAGTVTGSTADSDWIGVWEYDDYYLWQQINADGTWGEYNRRGLSMDGCWEMTSDGLQMYLPDGSEWYLMTLDGDVMTDDGDDTMFPSSLPDFEDTGLNGMGIVGVWEYTGDDMDAWIQIYESGSFILYDENGLNNVGDVRILSDDTVGLYDSTDDDDDDSLLELTVIDDDTVMDGADEEFVRSELPYSTTAGSTSVSTSGSYDGVWEYDDYDMWIEINDADGTFTIYDTDGEALSGTLAGPAADGSVVLNAEGESVSISLRNNDTLVDWDGDTLFRSELPDF